MGAGVIMLNWCEADNSDPRSSQQIQCRNKARYGRFCGVHSPEQQAKRRKVHQRKGGVGRAVRLHIIQRGKFNRVLECARELAEVSGRRGAALRQALRDYDSTTVAKARDTRS